MNIYDISERAGVSIATVSRVLNNSPHVSEKTRRKVLRVIEQSGYVPNAFARGLGLGSMKTVGLVCPDASDAYLATALSYLEHAFRSQDYDCILTCTGRTQAARIAGVENLCSRHVDGIVLMGSSFVEDRDEDNAYIREAAGSVPVVMLNGAYAAPRVYCVLCDDTRAVREAVQMLVDDGRRRILYLYRSANHSGRKKLAGYEAGLLSRQLPVDSGLIVKANTGDGGEAVQQVRDQLLALHGAGLQFDAVLTSEDFLAVGALKFARSAGLEVPRDLAVVGYNNSGLCLCTEPELTSVDNRLPAICEQITQTMMGVLEGREMPQQIMFTCEMIRRGTA